MISSSLYRDVRAQLLSLRGFIAVAGLVVLVIVFGRIVRDVSTWSEYPDGCDLFGYLRQAKLFQTLGYWVGLDTRVVSPASLALIDAAKATKLTTADWTQVIAPLCHNYKPQTDQVILQYPPGTGFLMSFFPETIRMRWTMFVSLTIATTTTFLLACLAPTKFRMILLLAAACLVLKVVRDEANGISIPSSLAIMPLIAAFGAYCLSRDQPRQAPVLFFALGLLIGLITNVRIPNGFIILGYGSAILLSGGVSLEKFFVSLKKCVGMSLGFLTGLIPTLLANQINTGFFLRTTYAADDTAPPELSIARLSENFHLLATSHQWSALLFLAFIAAAVMSAFQLKRPSRAISIAVIVNFLFSAFFYLTHWPLNSYYVVPVAAWGVLTVLCTTQWRGFRANHISRLSIPLLCIMVFLSLNKKLEQKRSYDGMHVSTDIEQNAVVWSLTPGSALVYFDKGYAAKLDFAKPQNAKLLIEEAKRRSIPMYAVQDDGNSYQILGQYGFLEPAGKLGDANLFRLRY